MYEKCIYAECINSTGFGYTLSLSLIPILDGMCEWGDKNRL